MNQLHRYAFFFCFVVLFFRLTKTGRFNGIFRRQTVPQNIAPESQIQPERNCMLQELFIDIFL